MYDKASPVVDYRCIEMHIPDWQVATSMEHWELPPQFDHRIERINLMKKKVHEQFAVFETILSIFLEGKEIGALRVIVRNWVVSRDHHVTFHVIIM